VQPHGIALAVRQHAVEHDHFARLRGDAGALCTALVGRRSRPPVRAKLVWPPLATSDMYQNTVTMRFL
jgi:hypothetical protein